MGHFSPDGFGKNYDTGPKYQGGASISGQKGEIYIFNKNRHNPRKDRVETYVSASVVSRIETKIECGLKSRRETFISSPIRLKQAVVTYVQSGLRSLITTKISAAVFDKEGRRLASKQERYDFLMKMLLEHLIRKEMARRKK